VHITRSELLAQGCSDGQIARAVRDGRLTRIRAGHFAEVPLDELTARAIRVGGRLACVSELRRRGVWVLDTPQVHVHLPPTASRLRIDPHGSRGHWRPLVDPERSERDHVSITDALLQAHRCLSLPAWIASVDSCVHLGRLTSVELGSLRNNLRARDAGALDLADAAAESGLESIVRVIARQLGFRVRSQVVIPGVGRIDLIVEDWIVIETDGSAFHDLPLAARDRRRDAQLASLGRTVLRPGYQLVVHHPGVMARQLIGAVETHRRVQDSGRLVSRARRRLDSLGLT
jgi:very-short-patch-repair endonuclease